jgi:tRNA G10  N-methylase Trm11
MKSYLSLSKSIAEQLPPQFQDDEVRFPARLVEHFLEEFSQPGDRVLDPFAGYGTTLRVAEVLGRIPYGVELSSAKVEYARNRLAQPANLIQGDARQLASLGLPNVQFAITSPPYMSRNDPENPLTDYRTSGRGYRAYLEDMRAIFGQLRSLLEPGSILVIEAANIKQQGLLTTLAWDLAGEVSHVLHFEGEVVICWDQAEYGYDHSYCLVFSAL